MNHSSDNHDAELQKAERIAYLIAGHLQGTLSPDEQDELDAWIVESDDNLELFEKLTDEDNIDLAMQQHHALQHEKAEALAAVKHALGLKNKRSFWSRIGPFLLAASLLLLAVSIYLVIDKKETVKPLARRAAPPSEAPPSGQAVLTLSDGRTLILGTSVNGLLAEDGGAKVFQPQSGEITYQPAPAVPSGYHTLSVPRGGQYQLALPDGTRVWLNAESSLRFPAAFTTSTRGVELRGEAYFEVAKDPAHPFTVSITTPSGTGGSVTVLGTHFNVNAYADDGTVRTTLLEGSVKVEKNGAATILQPGQQALINSGITVTPTLAADALAWKEGKFLFRNESIRSIGEQIKRWYDVEVQYEGTITQRFNTEVNRSLPLPKLLSALEGTGEVHFTLKGKKLIIRP